MTNTAPIGVVPEWTAADRLVKARQVAGLTQVELAKRLGIAEKTVKRYEASGDGKRGTLIGWAFTCGVDVAWLLGESGPPPRDGVSDQEFRQPTCNDREAGTVLPFRVAA